MNPRDAASASLDRLHDLVLPPPVPWWPPAPGWYWIIGLLFAGGVVLLVGSFLRWQHNRYRREALHELAREWEALRNPASRPDALATVDALLKRAALTAFPRTQVAELTGAPWIDFLTRTGRSGTLTPEQGSTFEHLVFDPRAATAVDEAQTEEFAICAHEWLAHHRARPPGRGT